MTIFDYQRIIGSGRGKRGKNKDKFNEREPPRLSEILADRVTGRHMQDAILLCVGQRGSGKSHFLLNLAVETAKVIASRKGGTWEDYFSPENNIAVISGEEITNKLQNLKRLQVVILDDIGADVLSGRSFMSRENRDLSGVLQICRTERNVILISVPMRELTDINIGRFASYFCEIAEPLHDHGLTLVKCFSQKPQYRAGGRMLFPYIRWQGKHKIIRFISKMPPPDIVARYNIVRDEQARAVMEKQRATSRGDGAGEKISYHERHWRELESQHGDEISRLHETGLSSCAIAKEIGLHKDTVGRLIKRQKARGAADDDTLFISK
jgi:hypothetical protein